ncbi:hypothetical protein TNCV_4835341 [Trichonephila clavipes]|nr:hypothetical protein TNCV_4835341 [Trichonephila clavipes]
MEKQNHLEDNIHRVIADIRPQMLEKVIENWTSRLDYIRASRGSHMPEVIFNMCKVLMPYLATVGAGLIEHISDVHNIFYSSISRLGGVVGLSLAFCTQGCGFHPGPNRRIFMMQKIDSVHVTRLCGMYKIT